MLVYKQWCVSFNMICDFSTINIFVLTASKEIFLYIHVTSKKTAPNFWITLFNFRQECGALYSDPLNA